jgi:hypothetical protein
MSNQNKDTIFVNHEELLVMKIYNNVVTIDYDSEYDCWDLYINQLHLAGHYHDTKESALKFAKGYIAIKIEEH